MTRDVLPENTTPILVCGGAMRCGWARHRFIRTDRGGNATGRQMFACGTCSAERVWGVIDLNATVREAVQ